MLRPYICHPRARARGQRDLSPSNPRIIRAILQSSPTRSIHSSSGDPNPHRLTNTSAQRSSIRAIVIVSRSGA